MTRYAGIIARPFIKWYANREVIACALRVDNSDVVTIIYTPFVNRRKHFFYKKQEGEYISTITKSIKNFSGDAVYQVELAKPVIGEIYKVKAEHTFKNGTRVVSSPNITIKEETERIDDVLHTKSLLHGKVLCSFLKASQHKPMIYFLIIENMKGECLVGIYTREIKWIYPEINNASLTVGERNIKKLENGKEYIVKLLLVDYEGWVSHMAVSVFTYEE